MFRAEDETAIRKLLEAVRTEMNAQPQDALGSVTRAAQMGAFFTEDVVIDLGPGTERIVGRETLAGMARRLEPRTAEFTVTFEDIGVQIAADGMTAEVVLTAEFARLRAGTGGHSLDAREFAAVLRKIDGEWYIAHVTAVDTLRK